MELEEEAKEGGPNLIFFSGGPEDAGQLEKKKMIEGVSGGRR